MEITTTAIMTRHAEAVTPTYRTLSCIPAPRLRGSDVTPSGSHGTGLSTGSTLGDARPDADTFSLDVAPSLGRPPV